MDIPSTSRGLADLSHSLYHARCFQKCVEGSNGQMMDNRMARGILGLFLLVLLAIPFAIKQMSGRQVVGSPLDTKTAALTRHGFYLEEAASAAGINFVHRAPTLDHQLDHIMPEVASMGAAVSIVDFD